MTFAQLVDYDKKNIFLQKSSRKWGRKTSSRPLFDFSKRFIYEVEASGLQISFNIFRWLLTSHTMKINFRLLVLRYAQFSFFRKVSENSFSSTICVSFFKRKCFSCCILLTDKISLSDCFYFLRYQEIIICIATVFLTRLWRHKIWY